MKTLVAVPCMDYVPTAFLRALMSLQVAGEVQFTFAQSSLIYDARNLLAGVAIDGGFDRVLWLDSDMVFDPHLFMRLSEHLDMGKTFVSGLYFSRKPPMQPVLYKDLYLTQGGAWPTPHVEPFADYPRDELFAVKGCGFGAVMMTTQLLRDVRDKFGLPFSPMSGWGEDLSFCLRAAELGETLWCDSSIKLGHLGQVVYDESAYRARLGPEA